MAAGEGFHCRVERMEDFVSDQPLLSGNSYSQKKWLYIAVHFDGGHLPVVNRGVYILGLHSFMVNPHDEIQSVLKLAGVPWSSGSDTDLLDNLVTLIQAAVESAEQGGDGMGGGLGLGIIPLLVYITSVEAREEKVYNCILCEEDVVDGEGEEPECGHVFHQDCIFTWLQENDTCCPTCGYEIDMDR